MTAIRGRKSSATETPRGACVAVTGGANGIGRAIAEHFARAGARVAIGDIDGEAAQRAASELGREAIGAPLDVGDEASYAAFLDAAEKAHGHLGVLINNAGVDWMGPFDEETNEVSRRQLEVNLLGTIIGSRLALRRMLPRQAGHLVNIASAVGRMPQPGSAVYSATKHGIVGLTESLRLEYLNTGVRFTVVHPGYIPTAMVEGTERPSRWVPTASADDCARAILEAVQRNRFEVWVPSRQSVGIKLSALIPRAIRDRAMTAAGVGNISGDTDQSGRQGYHERMFGGPR